MSDELKREANRQLNEIFAKPPNQIVDGPTIPPEGLILGLIKQQDESDRKRCARLMRIYRIRSCEESGLLQTDFEPADED